MLIVSRGSLTKLSVISFGEQISPLRMTFSSETWVFTVVAMGHESALRMLQTTRLCPGTNVGFVRASCSVAPNEALRLDRLNATAGNPDLVDDWLDLDSPDGELDARVFAPLYSS